jgi:hypothetical protein
MRVSEVARALRIVTRPAPPGGRAEALAEFRRLRAIAKSVQVNYWVFEKVAAPGQWIEFVEGRDAQAVRDAARQLELPAESEQILSEVELD